MIHERKYDWPRLSKPFSVTPKEVDRAEENVTIIVRPQAAGTHGVFAVDVSNGRPIGIWYEVDEKGEIPRAVSSLQRDLDKFYGRGGQMSDRGRHRQKASAVERFESALLVERVATRFAASKVFIGEVGRTLYAIKIEGVDSSFVQQPLGRQLDDLKKIKEWQAGAKKDWISTKPRKGQKPMAELKRWMKSVNPSEVYAKWDLSVDDDTRQIFYKD